MPTLVLESLQSLKDYVGREIATTGWLPVTQERIRQFAEATGDRQWIHVDPERARESSLLREQAPENEHDSARN